VDLPNKVGLYLTGSKLEFCAHLCSSVEFNEANILRLCVCASTVVINQSRSVIQDRIPLSSAAYLTDQGASWKNCKVNK